MACYMTDGDRKMICDHGENERRWTFITSYAAVLSLLTNHHPITAREISREGGIAERSVRIIISDLDKDISKVREAKGGRVIKYVNLR